MKKSVLLAVVFVLVFALGSAGIVRAEIIPPYGPGQQIGYPAVVLCEKLTLREKPSSSSKALQTLDYGDTPIVVGADLPTGAKEENGFVYCTLGDSEDSPCGWISLDYIVINPAWYVTEKKTPVYAWNDTAAFKVALLDKATRLPILKEEGDWYLVSLRGAAGWIHK
ncbi:MAG: SH3 domain-containing protein [Clostridia bacterium]|nr:SH3 domain-containing protein [Clostridia bacterium]MBR4443425.1 SH3 domain-containing protein [Clostridia bacterium]